MQAWPHGGREPACTARDWRGEQVSGHRGDSEEAPSADGHFERPLQGPRHQLRPVRPRPRAPVQEPRLAEGEGESRNLSGVEWTSAPVG